MKMAGRAADYTDLGVLKKITRFSIVGIFNTLIDFLMFTIFHEAFGAGYIISQIIGYSTGILNSFILNKKWTFEDKSCRKEAVNKLLQFILVNLITLIITLFFMNLLVKKVNVNVYAAKVFVTFIAQISNFLIYKLWIFNGGSYEKNKFK
ncbi:MAG: GtrA family protein [Bacillota bacterium]|nr:GtrA family protein [Bacillota bacterium]